MQPGIGGLDVFALAGDKVLFVKDRFRLGVVHSERGSDFASALDGLLVELVGAALGAIEVRLKLIAGVKEQVDGADRVGVGREFLAVTDGFEVNDGSSCGEDAPVDCVGEGLILGEAEARARRGERRKLSRGRGLLGAQRRQGSERKKLS